MDYMGRYSEQMTAGVSNVYRGMVEPSVMPPYTPRSTAGRQIPSAVARELDSTYSDADYQSDLQRAAVEGSQINYLNRELPGKLNDIARAMSFGDVDRAAAGQKDIEKWVSDNSDWLAYFLSSTSAVSEDKRYPRIGRMRGYAEAVSNGTAFSSPVVFSKLTGVPGNGLSVVDFVNQDTPQSQALRATRYRDQIHMDPEYVKKVARSSRDNLDYDLVFDELSTWNAADGRSSEDFTGQMAAAKTLMSSRIRSKQAMDSMLVNNGLWGSPQDQSLRNRAIMSYIGAVNDPKATAPDTRDFLEMCRQYRDGVSAAGGVDKFMDIETFCRRWKDASVSAATRSKVAVEGENGVTVSTVTEEATPEMIDQANRIRTGFARDFAEKGQSFDWFRPENQNLVRDVADSIKKLGADLKQDAGYTGIEDDAREYKLYELGMKSGGMSEGAARFARVRELCSAIDRALNPQYSAVERVVDSRGNPVDVSVSAKEPGGAADPLEQEIASAIAPRAKAALLKAMRSGVGHEDKTLTADKITGILRDAFRDIDTPMFNGMSETARDRILDEWFMPKLAPVYGAQVNKQPDGVPQPRTFTDYLNLKAYPELYMMDDDGSAKMAPVPYVRSLKGEGHFELRQRNNMNKPESVYVEGSVQDEVGALKGLSASHVASLASSPELYVGDLKGHPHLDKAVKDAAKTFVDYTTSASGRDEKSQRKIFDGAPVLDGTRLVMAAAVDKGLMPDVTPSDLDKIVVPLSRIFNGQVNTEEDHPSARKQGPSYISDSDAEKMDSEVLPAVMKFLETAIPKTWSSDKTLANQQKAFCAQVLTAIAPAIGTFYHKQNDPGSWFTREYAADKKYQVSVPAGGSSQSITGAQTSANLVDRTGYYARVGSVRDTFLALARRVDPVFEAGLRRGFSTMDLKAVSSTSEDRSDAYKTGDDAARKALESYNKLLTNMDPNFIPPSKVLLGSAEVPLDFGQDRYNPQTVLLALNESHMRETEKRLRADATTKHGDGFTGKDIDSLNRMYAPVDAVRVLSGVLGKAVGELEAAYGKDNFDGPALRARWADLIQEQVSVTDPKLFEVVSSMSSDIKNLKPYISRNVDGNLSLGFMTRSEMRETMRKSGLSPAAFTALQNSAAREFQTQIKNRDQAVLQNILSIGRTRGREGEQMDFGTMAQ